MVSMEVIRIAVLAEIAVLVEIVNRVKIAIPKKLQGNHSEPGMAKTLIFLWKYQLITPPRPRHGAFHPEIADFYCFHRNHKNRGFSEHRRFSGMRESCENHDFQRNYKEITPNQACRKH